jgi:hypothetical protein
MDYIEAKKIPMTIISRATANNCTQESGEPRLLEFPFYKIWYTILPALSSSNILYREIGSYFKLDSDGVYKIAHKEGYDDNSVSSVYPLNKTPNNTILFHTHPNTLPWAFTTYKLPCKENCVKCGVETGGSTTWDCDSAGPSSQDENQYNSRSSNTFYVVSEIGYYFFYKTGFFKKNSIKIPLRKTSTKIKLGKKLPCAK